MLISFEGIDFCGKTTQINLLKQYLEKHSKNVTVLREPGGTMLSEKIRKILLDKKNSGMTIETEILLFSASRAQLVRELVRPLLGKGEFVILDRYFDSTTAYQGYGRGIDLTQVEAINRMAVGDIVPEKTFFLDIPVDVAMSRRNLETADRMELNTIEFYEKVRNGYLAIAKKERRFVTIDARQSIENIHSLIIDTIQLNEKNL